MENNLTANRLKEALADAGLTQQELVEKSGVHKASISHYVTGKRCMGNTSATKIGRVLNVNPMWLMGFDVEKQRKQMVIESAPNMDNLSQVLHIASILSSLPYADQKSIEKIIEMTPQKREIIFDFINNMEKLYKENN